MPLSRVHHLSKNCRNWVRELLSELRQPNSSSWPVSEITPSCETSFKFICAQTAISPAHEQALANFLKPKKLLRRLDVSFDGAGQDVNSAPLIQTLQELPAIDVLGLDLLCERFNFVSFVRINQSLPIGLSALLLHVEVWASTVSSTEWVEMVRNLR